MNPPLRVIDTGLRPVRWNIAVGAALLEAVDCGCAPDTLRFHRYPRSVILGRNQNAAVEVDIDRCTRSGTGVFRRITGGGAVVMGPGVLAWDLVLRTGAGALASAGAAHGDAVVAALARLGLDARFVPPGSVEIDGRKVSGSAGRAKRRALLHQATLMLDLAGAAPLSLLRRRTEAGRPTADPAHRMTSLASALGAAASLAEAQAAVARAFGAALGRSLAPARLDPCEFGLARQFLNGAFGRAMRVGPDRVDWRLAS